MAATVAKIGNCSGASVDKFRKFRLATAAAEKVKAPMLAQCFANLECRLVEDRLVRDYSFFIFEVLRAHAPKSPKYPKTIHYRGDGMFMVSGRSLNLRRHFRPGML